MKPGRTLKDRTHSVPIYHNSCFAMGTRLNVVVTDSISSADAVFDEIVDAVRRIEAKLTRFDECSVVYEINQYAGNRSVEIDSEMSHVLLMCLEYYRRTDGNFDITLPSKYEVQKDSLKAVTQRPSAFPFLLDCISVDVEKQTVSFADAAMQIDLGGFGKGYALKEVESILKSRGVQNALVSFGESSILAMGQHPYGDCWKIGIENVMQSGRSAYVFELRNQSLSVSGFQKAANGSPGFHIISPGTQRPVERTSTVAVQSSDPLDAEVLSTAVYAALETDTAFRANFDDCRVVRVDYTNEELTEIYTYE